MVDDNSRFTDDIFTACSYREHGGYSIALPRCKSFPYVRSEVSNEHPYFDIIFRIFCGFEELLQTGRRIIILSYVYHECRLSPSADYFRL